MKAIILAAGRGSRLRSETDAKPKALTMLGGYPLIAHQIYALEQAGIRDIAVVTGYKAEMLEGFGSLRLLNARWQETNMVQSLCCANEWLLQDDCLISYSDIFYAPDVIRSLANLPGSVALTSYDGWRSLWEARFVDPLSDAESFKLQADGTLVSIGERAASLDDIDGQYMGLLKLTPAGWHAVQQVIASLDLDRADKLDMTSLLQLLLARHVSIATYPTSQPWGEVDTPEDRMLYEAWIETGKLVLPISSSKVMISAAQSS